MEPRADHLRMYGERTDIGGIEWDWARAQLEGAGAYWIVTPGSGHPHPRPVWGVWHRRRLFVSIGSPKLRGETVAAGPVTVHLGSVTDVVILEGVTAGASADRGVLDLYDAKYDWNYSVDEYGPFTVVEPMKVMAWQSAGWAGREGFQATGKWLFTLSAEPRNGS